jgi:hypothetical protein
MSCAALRVWLSLAAVLSLTASLAQAQPPDVLREYRFLPRLSTLEVTGGFAGLDIEAHIEGTFGFVNGFIEEFPHLRRYAAFVDVQAEAINPTDFGPYSFDLESTLKLSELDGTPRPWIGPLDVYRFVGEDGQGAPLRIHVAQLGRWLLMSGANDPPCCDFFNYRIRAVARQTPLADFTEDGAIDDADRGRWERGFGAALAHGASLVDGDANGNRWIDGGDFLSWQQQRGEAAPSFVEFEAALAAAGALVTAAPEPATWMVFLTGSTLLAARRRRAS